MGPCRGLVLLASSTQRWPLVVGGRATKKVDPRPTGARWFCDSHTMTRPRLMITGHGIDFSLLPPHDDEGTRPPPPQPSRKLVEKSATPKTWLFSSTVSVKTGTCPWMSRSQLPTAPRALPSTKKRTTAHPTAKTGAPGAIDRPPLNPPAAFFMDDWGMPLPKRACDGLSSLQTNSTSADAPCSEALVQHSSPICASNVVVGPTQLPSAAPAAASAPELEVLLSLSDHFQHCNVKQLRAMARKVTPHALRMNRAELLEHLARHSIEQAISGGGAVASHEPR